MIGSAPEDGRRWPAADAAFAVFSPCFLSSRLRGWSLAPLRPLVQILLKLFPDGLALSWFSCQEKLPKGRISPLTLCVRTWIPILSLSPRERGVLSPARSLAR